MYFPKHNEQTDIVVLHALIRSHPPTQGDGELLVKHIPLLLDSTRGDLGTSVGHVAKANSVWKWKVSQNRPTADRIGIVAGLLERNDPQSSEMATLVKQHV